MARNSKGWEDKHGRVAQKELTVHPWEACEQGDSLLKRNYQSVSHP